MPNQHKTPVILFRASLAEEDEFEACQQHFETYQYRSQIPENSVVIGRYSVLPYYKELVEDCAAVGSTLINSLKQHLWIADFHWYNSLQEFNWTPKSWTDVDFCDAPEGNFVVKGATNSKKQDWNTKMFAASKRDALDIAGELSNDGLIHGQDIIYREYVPLQTFEIGINGLPFTNEYRFFYLGNHLVSVGYYWSIAEKAEERNAHVPEEAFTQAQEIADEISKQQYTTAFVLDLAQTEEGNWILIEINDFQMSGLSMIDPAEMYHSLNAVCALRNLGITEYEPLLP
ncbi:MAG: hypothetical protein DRJ03_24085 [Chloroflexi bacterium]|nr:MAG: hypothetical protein DRJ03_24085 [Chloroflexota bacterium]